MRTTTSPFARAPWSDSNSKIQRQETELSASLKKKRYLLPPAGSKYAVSAQRSLARTHPSSDNNSAEAFYFINSIFVFFLFMNKNQLHN